jgi:hypothetical protein
MVITVIRTIIMITVIIIIIIIIVKATTGSDLVGKGEGAREGGIDGRGVGTRLGMAVGELHGGHEALPSPSAAAPAAPASSSSSTPVPPRAKSHQHCHHHHHCEGGIDGWGVGTRLGMAVGELWNERVTIILILIIIIIIIITAIIIIIITTS